MKFALLCAVLAATATSFGAIRAVTPDMYGGNTNAWQVARHNQKMSVVTNGGAKVVFIGDSITHFWENGGKSQLQKFYSEGDLKMLNLGTSADRTEHVLWRLTEGRELDGYRAKVIFLMIGTNNTGHFPFEKEPPIDTILGIREIVRVIRAKQPAAKLVLTAIFPRGVDANDGCRRRNAIVNKEIRNFADGKNVFWLDFNDQFLTPDGLLSPDVFPDRLHPCAYGYELWAAATLPYAQAAVAGLPMPPNRFPPYVRPETVRLSGAPAVYPTSRCGLGWWLDRMLARRNQIADSKGAIDIVMLGDSITNHFDDDSGRESLAELRKTYTVLNCGYSGDRTENLLWRAENGELDGYKAKCITLLIGTNNTWHRNDKPADTAAGIKKILEVIARKQPQAKTLLHPIFPFGAGPKDAKRVSNEAVNAIIKDYADGEKVIWVDFNAKFLDEKGDVVKYMPDHCHPNAAGYKEVWIPSVLPYFQKIVGK